MTTISFPPLSIDTLAPFPVRRFTVDEYHRLAKINVLTEEDRVELLEGWIVPKMTPNPPHSASVQLVDAALRKQLPVGWCLRIHDAITTGDSEPEPDVAVVKGVIRDFSTRHPGPAEIGLLVEVSDSSVARDHFKCGLYARAAIPVYWIVNVLDRRVEVYTDPTGPDTIPRYRCRDDYDESGEVPLVLDGKEVVRLRVSELLV